MDSTDQDSPLQSEDRRGALRALLLRLPDWGWTWLGAAFMGVVLFAAAALRGWLSSLGWGR